MMDIAEIKGICAAWTPARLAAAGIDFKENLNPSFETADDYRVIYEVIYEPKSLDKARLELWLSEEGGVAVGVEHTSRVFRRLADRNVGRCGFIAGHEPGTVKIEAIKSVLDMVARGKLSIEVTSIFGFAFSAKALVDENTHNDLTRWDDAWKNHPRLKPVKGIHQKAAWWRKVLRYKPWEESNSGSTIPN
jgi:hypothetical protein